MDLLSSSYFALFLIVAIGFIVGNIKIKGISLDVSAVIFVALVFGHYGVTIPNDIQKIGLTLFIFTIGIQAGPGFFESFKKNGRELILLAFILVGSASLITLIVVVFFQIDMNIAIGLLTGSLTSTPGLAAAIESTQSPLASIGYGIAYPFGVIAVILFARLYPKLVGVDIQKEAEKLEEEVLQQHPELVNKNLVVENENIVGKSIKELKIRSMTQANISRIMHNGKTIVPLPSTILEKGDIVRLIGAEQAIEKARILIGEETIKAIPLSNDYVIESILVTNKQVVNKTLGQLNVLANYNARVTRIRRAGIDIVASSKSEIRFGDKLVVACSTGNISNVRHLFGNESKKLSDTDFFPIATGIVLGVLVGKLKISFTDDFTFSLGLTGGILIVALVLSRIGKTGPILWTMSGSSNQLLRQLGLLMFLSVVGTSAGSHLVETFKESGFILFSLGIGITLLPMIITTLIGHFVLKMNILNLLGTLTGSMTSTPGLAAVDGMTDSAAPSIAYATVYPIAMVLLMVCVQLLSMW
ncbi:TrkA C-terminal domain-containing protein [Labilibaculum sp. K2S]|uniref:aspartate:alanine exchanger family transporter n=1 Tax=Labilibaculum sp. K2S TaxID=3056386 RepID=UPI0025A44126|nr:TrkA C-terminal domain-containing protein [Labilibaculum sp. K2S]MDM8160400.1 TrkA C-terminal domain-containing protein [Labilibaculum sp. K2S]